MKSFILTILTSLMFATSSGAVILSFDDVPGGSIQNGDGNMPTYQGYVFSYTLDWVDLEGSVWKYGAHSGDFAILNNNAGIGSVMADDNSDFTFEGLWAKMWYTPKESGDYATLSGTLEGYNDGNLIWSISTVLNGSYQYFVAQEGPIDDLRLGFGNYFLVDDLELKEYSPPVPVPVPAGLPLMLGGLGMIALLRFRPRTS
ncbi:hypothetical protein [Puniceibacterium sediminis]|uniref:VPLPA-CTERM protein sorting domain-containing protein n=1 Tax=Puniceibacterium sediminis TaxID=1608407 RepID=A0A238WNC6_9RHOB|nr:hypothetical protein [Puniceibacterium sediminis]SNR47928.1 hypothetical protein SAMN06265370_106176 [Puniceibacterium sediminis]